MYTNMSDVSWTYTTMKWIYSEKILLITFTCCLIVSSACTWPTVLQHSIWHDSDKGGLTFTDTEMSGWTLTGGNQMMSVWDCFYYTSYATHDIIIYKARSVMAFFDGNHRPFICMKLNQITTNSFYYYQLSAEESQIENERVSMPLESTAASITDANAEAELCVSDEINGPSVNEYHVLVKQGMEAEATQTCAPSFFGQYWYNITDDDMNWSCDNTSFWDVCADRQFMVFNYTNCGVKIAETDVGEVRCLLSISSGSDVLQTVLTTDNSTNRFTCIKSRLEENTGRVFASLAPNSCKKSQTPDSLPVLADGTTVGQVVLLTPYPDGLCPIIPNTTTSAPASASDSPDVPTAAVVGGVLGTLALIALVILLILACKTWKLRKCCFSDRKHDKSQTKGKRGLYFLACLIPGKQSNKGTKLKDDMSIEDLPHKRIPHFIHEQPETAPNGTALEARESKLTGKSAAEAAVSAKGANELIKPAMTPVEIPDETGKSSQASFNTVSPIAGKRRNLSSVSLDVISNNGRLTDSSLTQSVFIDSPTKSSRYDGSMDESFDSDTHGTVSALSNYADKSQSSQKRLNSSQRKTGNEAKSVNSHLSRSKSRASQKNKTGSVDSHQSKSTSKASQINKTGSVDSHQSKSTSKASQINKTGSVDSHQSKSTSKASQINKTGSVDSHQNRSKSSASQKSNKTTEDGKTSGLKPIRPISSCDSFAFQSPTNNQATSELARHLRQTASCASIPSIQLKVVSLGSKTTTSINQKPFNPTNYSKVTSPHSPSTTSWESYESVSNTHEHTLSSIQSLNSRDNLSQSSLTSSVPSESNKHSITSRKTKRTDRVLKSKASPITDRSQAKGLDNMHTQSTQTEISSLEVLFRAHGYPEQVYPKSVKTGIYYISDSPLEPIEEGAEHSEAKVSAREAGETHVGGEEEKDSVRKLYSENTFSSQWTTVEEETVDESSSDSESLGSVNNDETKVNAIRASVVKNKANVLDASLLYRTPTYDGYEPDSD